MAFQLLHKTAYALYFISNQSEIAEKHCVNKNRSEMKCDGRCHLRKYLAQQMAEEEEDQPQQNEIWTDLEELPLLFCAELLPLNLKSYLFFSDFKSDAYSDLFLLDRKYQKSIFHPPIF
jgi:hypothetical protein